jgi:hypothetical protein
MWNEIKMNLDVGMPRIRGGNINRYNKRSKRQRGDFGLKKKLFHEYIFSLVDISRILSS